MRQMQSLEELEYESAKAQREQKQTQPKEAPDYVPRPRWQKIVAWALIGVLILGIAGMCYWQIFGIF